MHTQLFSIAWLLLGAAVAAGGQAALKAGQLERTFEVREGIGNIAVSPDGRVVASVHQFFEPEVRVIEVLPDGTTRPFPTPEWAGPPRPDGRGVYAVLGLQADREGIVWMADNGARKAPPRVIAWDLRKNALHRVIAFASDVAPIGSFPNDLAVDRTHEKLVLADAGNAETSALIVVDLATGTGRRVLAGHPLVAPEDIDMVIEGRIITVGPGGDATPVRVGVNPITIDRADEWVYFGAMSGTSLYRVRTTDLYDEGLSDDALAERVQRFGDKPISDGISIDDAGNVYVTDIQLGAVGVTHPDGSYEIMAEARWVSWPDSIAAGPDGALYIAINQLHLAAPLNRGVYAAKPPFIIARLGPLAPITVGR